jgi:hypothetical protein
MDNSNEKKSPLVPLLAADVEDKPTEWFYPNVFVRGELNGIQGIPGDGKTWLMCELAAKTSVGGAVQGIEGNDSTIQLPLGKVLYLSGDDSPERLKERLAMCGGNLSEIAFPPEGMLPQIGSVELTELFSQIRPVLCIVDTLQHFINGASVNDLVAITRALQPIQALARQFNTAIVSIMHVSKFAASGNAGDSSSFAIGSYAIVGLFRSLWTLGRLKDEHGKPSTTRALCLSKSNYTKIDPPALLFELRDGFHWVGVDLDLLAEDLYTRSRLRGRPAEKRDLVKGEILRVLGGGEPVLSSLLEEEVCKATGCHYQTIKTAKKELGVVSFQSGQKWYCRLPVQKTEISQSTINAQSTKNSESGQTLLN